MAYWSTGVLDVTLPAPAIEPQGGQTQFGIQGLDSGHPNTPVRVVAAGGIYRPILGWTSASRGWILGSIGLIVVVESQRRGMGILPMSPPRSGC
jgi:hypothetical protein